MTMYIVYNEWSTERADMAAQVRIRNILKINNDFKSRETREKLLKLLKILPKLRSHNAEKNCFYYVPRVGY